MRILFRATISRGKGEEAPWCKDKFTRRRRGQVLKENVYFMELKVHPTKDINIK